eukprot:8952986-Pyramimonas_sp.AAC.1
MYTGASYGTWSSPRNPYLLPRILGVCNVGNTAFRTFVPLVCCTTRLEDASGILHFKSGSEAYGCLDLTDKSPPEPLLKLSSSLPPASSLPLSDPFLNSP